MDLWLTGRRAGKTDAAVEAMRENRGGAIVVDPEHAAAMARKLRAAGATVTVTIGCDWPDDGGGVRIGTTLELGDAADPQPDPDVVLTARTWPDK